MYFTPDRSENGGRGKWARLQIYAVQVTASFNERLLLKCF